VAVSGLHASRESPPPTGAPFDALTQESITHYGLNPVAHEFRSFLRRGAYRIFMYNPFAHLPVFLLGMALGRYKVAFASAPTTFRARLVPHAALLLIFGLLAISGSMPHLLLHNSLIAVAFAGFVYYAEALWGPLARLLTAPVTVLLGEASYEIYILQMPLERLYEFMLRLFHRGSHDGQLATPVVLIGFLVLLCATATIVFLKIERPAKDFYERH
jgi:peptidoglycan/LPS O-acetylase OafA/YrhL